MWFKKLWHLCLEWIRTEAEGSLRFTGNVWPWLEGEGTCSLFSLLLAKKCERVSGSRRAASGAVKPPTAWDKGIDRYLSVTGRVPSVSVSFNSCIVVSYSTLLTQTGDRIGSHLKVRFTIWRVESCLTPGFLCFQYQAHEPGKWLAVKSWSCSQVFACRVCLIALIL